MYPLPFEKDVILCKWNLGKKITAVQMIGNPAFN